MVNQATSRNPTYDADKTRYTIVIYESPELCFVCLAFRIDQVTPHIDIFKAPLVVRASCFNSCLCEQTLRWYHLAFKPRLRKLEENGVAVQSKDIHAVMPKTITISNFFVFLEACL